MSSSTNNQDPNAIQEKICFHLASDNSNLCVVGDDGQAPYRFRDATAENFVEFPEQCKQFFDVVPTTIPLNTNYRSRKTIVDFYTKFMEYEIWQKDGGKGSYRPRRVHYGHTYHWGRRHIIGVLTLWNAHARSGRA